MAVVLAAGGLVLVRAPGHAAFPPPLPPIGGHVQGVGTNVVSFQGSGAHGQIALSHTSVLAGASQSVFAEVRLTADAAEPTAARAPLSLAVVLDTSGSMEGDKLAQAKRSVIEMVREMRDGDEIAMVRYASDHELVQPLARVGEVRDALIARIHNLEAGGGTNIPGGLSVGLRALDAAEHGRVRRVVLVSDGLDSTRTEAERLASAGFETGVTLSSMGIGLDFDESYMGGVAHSGHGNFGFVKDAAALATFLRRELKEAAATTVENATVRVKLPRGLRFVRATGAGARAVDDGASVELQLGSLFAGDERRALMELTATMDDGESRSLEATAAWSRVGGGPATVAIPRIDLLASRDAAEVARGRDGAVLASATSVIASQRELEAAEAYSKGDAVTADRLIGANLAALSAAAAAAPPAMASSLAKQQAAYSATRSGFGAAAPGSAGGKIAAKQAAEKDLSNIDRATAY
jgi:Ca-activated chloride channel family protein